MAATIMTATMATAMTATTIVVIGTSGMKNAEAE
jgi:hypothetical protein